MNSSKIKNQEIINSAVEYLQEKFQPEIVFLYGSRSRGDYEPESDVDLMCFCESPSQSKEARLIDGIFLDSWLYNFADMDPAKDNFLCLLDGQCLVDSEGRGKEFLNRIKQRFEQGPDAQTAENNEHSIQWVNKMIERITRRDIEGNYRQQWLLVDLLPIYFQLRNKWYMGSKKSFQWLKINDEKAFKLFDIALKAPQDHQAAICLAKYVINA